MKYSAALSAMLRGLEVARKGKPDLIYSFDGADGYRVWVYNQASDQLTHIDNVSFDDMMADDWYVAPRQERSRKWAFFTFFARRRFNYIDGIGISLTSFFWGAGAHWSVLVGVAGVALLATAFIEGKWGTHV